MGPSIPDAWEFLRRVSPFLWRVGTIVAVLSLLAEILDMHPDAACKCRAIAALGAAAGLYYALTQAGGPWLPTAGYALGLVLPLALRAAVGRGMANVAGALALMVGWSTMPS